MTANCLCGATSVTIAAKPDFIHDCNCGLCRKVGAAWGYFSNAQVSTTGQTTAFIRRDKPNAGVEVKSCQTCGSTTHFALAPAFKAMHPEADMVGVNMRLFDPEELVGVEVRYPDGKNWTGEGAFAYRRPPMTISEGARW